MKLRKLTRRLIAVSIVLGVVAALAIAAPIPDSMSFHANPRVPVVHVTPPSGGSGSSALVNNTVAPVMVGSITRDVSCDPAVTMGVTAPFTVQDGASTPVTFQCASGAMTGIKRCLFHVNAPGGGAPLTDFLGVCEYGSMPSIGPSQTTLDFGTVAVGGEAMLSASVLNTSPTSITQLHFQTTDFDGNFEIGAPCTQDTARECTASIPATGNGASAAFTIWCRPKTSGMHAAQLHIATDTSQYINPPINLLCNATGSPGPAIAVTGSPVNAGDIEVTSGSGSGVVTIRNAGAGTLQIKTAMIIDGGNGAAADWTYVASGPCSGAFPPTCNLAAEEEVTLDVTFDPSAIGVRNASLLIGYFDDADRSLTVPLNGSGRGGTLSLVGMPTINFGLVPLNVTSTSTFVLANNGNRTLTDVALAAMPSGSPFAIVTTSPTTVTTTATTTVSVSCRPTAVGTFTTTFTASSPTAFNSPPISVAATCEGTNMALYSDPTTLSLGDLRTGTTPPAIPIDILGTSPLTIESIELETPDPNLMLTASPGLTPLTATLTVIPTTNGDLENAILVRASNDEMLRIPISGQVVTAAYDAPPPKSLGTFCVNQPTTPNILKLVSTGTASFRMQAPIMERTTTSPFDLLFTTPSVYPANLPAGAEAVVQITPKRQTVPGLQQDFVIWSTDVATQPTAETAVSASFIDDGGAIAPSSLMFAPHPIHRENPNGQSVTLQNCDTTPLMLDDPMISSPFELESTLPRVLAPNEIATISVGFHPTRVGPYTGTLVIGSPQLAIPLMVALSGEGISTGGEGDGGTGSNGFDQRSFYGCSGCSSRQPSGAIMIVLAVMCALLILRRKRRITSPSRSGSS